MSAQSGAAQAAAGGAQRARRHAVDVHVPALHSVLLRAYDLAAFGHDQRPYRKRASGPGSGARSSHWALDMRIPLSRSDVLRPVAREMLAGLGAAGVTQIAGYGYGSYALVGAILAGARQMTGALIRTSAKDYGFCEIVEGELRPDLPVVIVDDLLSSGRSALGAAAILRARGCSVTAVYTVFRFGWRGGRGALRADGMGHKCLATLRAPGGGGGPRQPGMVKE